MDDFQVDVSGGGCGQRGGVCGAGGARDGRHRSPCWRPPPRTSAAATAPTPPAPCAWSSTASTTWCSSTTSPRTRSATSISAATRPTSIFDDMGRVTNYRCDPDLTDILIGRSFETMKWMRSKGVRFQPSYGRQAFKVNGKYKFWGGLAVEAWGGGPGLVDLEHKAAVKAGIPIHYETAAVSLIEEDGVVRGVIARHKGRKVQDRRQGGGAGLRRLREQRRDAHALSRPDLGSRQGARHALQHRRRHQHGAGDRRQAARQLVGRPRRRLGHERAGVRRPRGRRQLPEALLPARHHGERQRRALRRRGRGLPQLHLRQVRRGDPVAAAAVRLADLRLQGARQAARRIPHQAHDQGARRHDRGAGDQARGRRTAAVPEDHQGMERRGHDRGDRSTRRSRTAAARAASRCRRATGPTRSTRRRSRPMP